MGRYSDVADLRPLRDGRARRLRLAVGGLIAVALAAGGCGGGSATEGADAGSTSATAAGGADSSPTTAPAEAGATTESQAPAEPVSNQASGDGASANGTAVAVSADVPDLEMVDVASGTGVRLASLVTGDKPLLLWFWAPH